MGVQQARGDAGFLLEPGPPLGILTEAGRQQLDRYTPRE